MDPTPRHWGDRAAGLLLGGALGDAVGRPFEGMPSVRSTDVDEILAHGELVWTDDTAMMLTLAEHLAALPSWHDDLDEDALAAAHARAWRSEPWRGYGAGPPGIFRAVLAGQDWRRVAGGAFGGGGSLGNGAAMRAAPLGALPAPVDRVAAQARRAAGVTHTHPEGRDGAVMIAVTAHVCLRAGLQSDSQGAPDPEELLVGIAARLATVRAQEAVAAVARTLHRDDPSEVAEVTGTGITALEAAPAALAAFLHHPSSPVDAVRFAVRMGGDTDTVATMAGALAGALAGEGALPGDLVARLEAAGRIRRAGHALARRAVPT